MLVFFSKPFGHQPFTAAASIATIRALGEHSPLLRPIVGFFCNTNIHHTNTKVRVIQHQRGNIKYELARSHYDSCFPFPAQSV